MAKRKPSWIPARREDQAGEVMDVEGDVAAVGILNENRKMETYMVPLSQLRTREIT